MTGFAVSPHVEARFDAPGSLRLEPGRATLEGSQIRTQVNEGRENIGFWDDPKERIHGLAHLPEPGTDAVRGELSCAGGPSGLKATLAGRSRTAEVSRTDGWFKPVFVPFGEWTIDTPGIYHVILEPADRAAWRPVNVYQLQAAKVD